MLTGMAMLAAVGLLWACNGVIMSVAERRGLLATELFCVSTALSLIVGLAMVFRDGTRMDISLSVGCVLAALMALAGAASILGAVCTQKAMSGGHNGVVWVVSQAALVLPFLMGSLAFDERFTWNGVTGLGCVLLCLTLFGACRQSGGQTAVHAPNWLTLTLGAFLLNGVCQCLASLPSYWRLPGLSAALRGTFLQAGAMLAMLTLLVARGRRLGWSSLWLALALAIIASASQYLLLFQGLDRLAKSGAGAVGYPLAIGTCVMGFSIYSILVVREKTSSTQYAALALGLSGIILMSCG